MDRTLKSEGKQNYFLGLEPSENKVSDGLRF